MYIDRHLCCSGWIALTKFPDFPDCAGVPGQRRTKNPRWELIAGRSFTVCAKRLLSSTRRKHPHCWRQMLPFRGSLVHAGFGFRKYCIPLRTRFWRSLIIEEFDDVAFLHEPGDACTLDGYVRYLWLSCSPLVLPGECVPVAPCRRAWMAPGGSH